MSVTFPNTASLLFRQEISPWYNGFNAPGSGSDGQLTFSNMDYNWYYLNSASYQTIEVIKGAAYTGSTNTFTEPQTFTSNVGISGSLTGSMANFSGQVISSYPGVGFFGTASWAANAITSSLLIITSSISASYASSSTSASFIYIASNPSTSVDYTLVFKNSAGALDNYYQLAADGTNGPYFNPSTNILHGVSLTVSASKGVFTSITGSLSGSLDGTASYATSASHALTASYVAPTSALTVLGTSYPSGSISVPNSIFTFIAGADKTGNPTPTVSININELLGKTLSQNCFVTATVSGSIGESVVVNNLVGGVLTFQSQNPSTDFNYIIMYI